MRKSWIAIAGISLLASFGVTAAKADSISSVEGARARERAGYHLSPQDREQLRRYGGNDDYGYRGYRDYGYYDGPSGGVSIYVGPRRGYGPYGY